MLGLLAPVLLITAAEATQFMTMDEMYIPGALIDPQQRGFAAISAGDLCDWNTDRARHHTCSGVVRCQSDYALHDPQGGVVAVRPKPRCRNRDDFAEAQWCQRSSRAHPFWRLLRGFGSAADHRASLQDDPLRPFFLRAWHPRRAVFAAHVRLSRQVGGMDGAHRCHVRGSGKADCRSGSDRRNRRACHKRGSSGCATSISGPPRHCDGDRRSRTLGRDHGYVACRLPVAWARDSPCGLLAHCLWPNFIMDLDTAWSVLADQRDPAMERLDRACRGRR